MSDLRMPETITTESIPLSGPSGPETVNQAVPQIDFKAIEEAIRMSPNPTGERQRTNAAILLSKVFPQMDAGYIYQNLDSLYEKLTGQPTGQNLNVFQVISKRYTDYQKRVEATQAFAYLNGRGELSDQAIVRGNRLLKNENNLTYPDEAARLKAAAEALIQDYRASVPLTDEDGVWWRPWIEGATDVGASVASIAGDVADYQVSTGMAAIPLGAIAGTVPAELMTLKTVAETTLTAPAKLGNAYSAFNAAAQMEANNTYMDLREKGLPDESAWSAAVTVGVLNGGLETLSLGADIVITKTAANLWRGILKEATEKTLSSGTIFRNAAKTTGLMTLGNTASETLTEGIQTLVGAIQENAAIELELRKGTNPELRYELDTLSTIWGETWETMKSTAMGVFLLGAAGVPAAMLSGISQGRNINNATEPVRSAKEYTERVTGTGQDVRAMQTLLKAQPPVEVVPFPEGQTTGFIALDPRVLTGRGLQPGDFDGAGVKVYPTMEAAENATREGLTGNLQAGPFLEVLRNRYPEAVYQAAAQTLQGARPTGDWTAIEAENDIRMDELLDLAQAISEGTRVEYQDELVKFYRLQEALTPGGILTVALPADGIPQVSTEQEAREAFKAGAQVVSLGGALRIKNPEAVTVLNRQNATEDQKVLTPVGDFVIRKNGDTYTATSPQGDVFGRLTLDTSDGLQIKDVAVGPEYRRQGVAKALVKKAVQDNPGVKVSWTRQNTVEGRALKESVQRQSQGWQAYGPSLRITEAKLEEVQANIKALKEQDAEENADLIQQWESQVPILEAQKAYFEEHLSTLTEQENQDPATMTPEEYREFVAGADLNRDAMQRVLEKQLSAEEAEATVLIMDRFAAYLGVSTDEFLRSSLAGIRLVNTIKSGLNQYANGATHVAAAGKAVVDLSRKANVTTILHEMFHVLRPFLRDEDMAQLAQASGQVNPFEAWTVDAEEKAARMFERYLQEGKAPTEGLRAIFDKLATWFRWIYEAIGRALPRVSDEAREVFDRILSAAEKVEGSQPTEPGIQPRPVDEAIFYQPAWHGSPHDFDEFTTAAMGTGEGAQAYGWGLYFAGSKDVAEWYREKLTRSRMNMKSGTDLMEMLTIGNENLLKKYHIAYDSELLYIVQSNMGRELVQNHLENAALRWDKLANDKDYDTPEYAKKRADAYSGLLQEFNNGAEIKLPNGQLYEVEIPDQDEFLDWDKRLSQQSEKVLNKLKSAGVQFDMEAVKTYESAVYKALIGEDVTVPDEPYNPTGEEVYKKITREKRANEYGEVLISKAEGERVASLFLKSIGIPGITYLDGNSRNAGEGSHNYVIFADEDVKVKRKLYQDDNPSAADTSRLKAGLKLFTNHEEATGKVAYFGSSQASVHQYLGSSGDIVILQKKLALIRKPESQGGHSLTDEEILETQANLYSPAAIFVSEGKTGRYVVVPGNFDRNGEAIIVAVQPNRIHDRRETLEVMSIYGKRMGEFWKKPFEIPGLIQYLDEKKWNQFLQTARLQLPMVGEISPEIKNSINSGKSKTLYQTDPDYREQFRQVKENERLIESYRESMESEIRELSKGKGPEFREELRRQREAVLKRMEDALEKSREELAAAVEFAREQDPDFDPHVEFTRQAVADGKVVPTASLLAYRDHDWAEAELARREVYRELIEEAKAFPDVEAWISEVKAWEEFSDEPKSADVQQESEGDPQKAEELYRKIYIMSQVKTAEEADKEFAASLTPEKVKEILWTIGRNLEAESEKNLPRHVRAQALKIQKNEANEKEIPRILSTMKNDPRTYRRIYWSFGPQGRDQALVEMLALEKEEESYRQSFELPEVKVDKPKLPDTENLELRTRIALGDKDRAWWTQRARALEAEVANLEAEVEAAEKAGAKQVREATQAGREARNSAAEEMKLTLRKKQADLRAARKMKAYHQDLVKRIMRPAGKGILVDYRVQIERLQELIDPNNRTMKTEARKAADQAWYMAHPEALATLGAKARREIFGRSMNLWDTKELETLDAEVKALRDKGREEFKAKQAAWDAEVEIWKTKVIDTLYKGLADLYDQEAKATDPEVKKSLGDKILAWEAARLDINAATAKEMEKGDLAANLLTISNLADLMDGGLAKYAGPNHDLLYTLPKRAETEKFKRTQARLEAMFAWMKDSGISPEDLGHKVQFDPHTIRTMKPGKKDVLSALVKEYSIDELLTIYVGMKNDKKRAALEHGNRVSPAVVEFVNQSPAFAKWRTLGDKIIEDYSQHVDRLSEAFHDYQNDVLEQEENYTPMIRQNISYESMDEQLSFEKGQAMTVNRASVDRGMTKSRLIIRDAFQTPIKLGEFSLWLQQVGRQEQYIAMAPVVKRLNQVYGSKDVNTAIQQTLGNGVAREVKEYTNLLANPYGSRTWNWLEAIAAKVRGNAAIAYMSWNPTTVLKQLPALAQYLPYVDAGTILASAGELISNPAKLWEKVDLMSPQVKNRIVYKELEDLEAGRYEGGEKLARRFGRIGMMGIPTMDKVIVLLGWNAVYMKSRNAGMTEAAAIESADFITMKTQATTSVIDSSGLFRKPSEFTRALTMFAGPTNKILNEMAYTMPRAFMNGQKAKAAWIGGAYIVGAVALWMLSKGRAPEEPEEYAEALAVQSLDLLPVAGPVISSQLRGWGDTTPNLLQPIVSGTDIALEAWKAVDLAQRGEDVRSAAAAERAVISTLETVGLAAGIPTTQPKRIYRAVKTGNAWELLGWRAEEE